ncbi:MAG: hypothetical protein ACR2JG_04240 [Geodermatophilaceae bacterium]
MTTDFYPTDTKADPEQIRRSAEGLQSISGVLLGHGDNVHSVLSQVALSFSEVTSEAVAAQIGDNLTALETAVEGTQYGYAVGSAWADDVDAFISGRAALIAQWEAAELTEFGVPPLQGLANAEPEMTEQMAVQRDRVIAATRLEILGDYIAEAARRWERFQDQVREKGRMFRDGPSAENLSLLVSYLGWSGMTLWPESATTPVGGTDDGAAAAATVVDGLDGGATAAEVAEALSTIAMITRRAAEGHELTDAELDYLEAFYATMGVRILDVPAYLSSISGQSFSDSDTPPRYLPSIPFNGSPELVEALTVAAANGLLVLSRPTSRSSDDARDGYERLPSWLRDTMAIEDNDPYNNPLVQLERLTDLGDLLGHSTVEAGTGLSRELAESVGWMIEYAEYREDSLSPEAEDDMRGHIAASAPALLTVVSRNDEVCFDLLTGSGMPDDFSPTDYFTDIYTFDWAADGGAAAASLTDFIPLWAVSDDQVEQGRAEAAMFDLVQIVTGDESFELLMDGVGNSGVAAESAVGQVNPAITQGFVAAMAPFMDQFAGEQVNNADPNAVPMGLRDLPFDTRVRFTTLIGTDTDSATTLAGVAYAYEQQELYEYVISGNTEVNGGNVGRIRGIVDAGLIQAETDAGADQNAAEAAAARTSQLGRDIAAGLLGGIPVPGASALIDTVAAVANAQAAENVPTESATPFPGRTEPELRYDTAAGVMMALVATGQVPPFAVPDPFVVTVPAEGEPSTDELTQALVNAAAVAGYDLNDILDRIESAYSDQELIDERGE